MKILLTADLHLGRSSSGLPPSAENLGMPTSIREAWLRIVDMALRDKVDAVLIAGDLVESSTAYYEAMGPLIEGFRKLQESGIDVFAVAGNHDASAFEKIAQEVEDMEKVHFIGRRGNWE
jgi:exonuclease SbcD